MSDGFFIADLPAGLAVGDTVEVAGKEAHHIATVRRIGRGEVITVADGQGRGVRGPVAGIERGRVLVTVKKVLTELASRPPITVVQALPKNDRAEWAIDLMTEVGVDRIVPWQAARSIVRWTGERGEKARARWQAVAREAAKQARRLTVPEIAPLARTHDVAVILSAPVILSEASPVILSESKDLRDNHRDPNRPLAPHRMTSVVFYEGSTRPVAELPVDPLTPLTIVIGPEGGLTPGELAAFEAAGAEVCSLGPTILRTSTAGAVAVAQLRALAGVARG
jgi:16S rRNA (uracil1498-N3)-methyltransferase